MLPNEDFKGIGYTKAKDLRAIINQENAKDWLEKARNSTIAELRKAIRAEKARRFGKQVEVELVKNTGQPDGDVNVSDAILISTGDNPHAVSDDEYVVKSFTFAPGQYRLVEQLLIQMRAETGSTKEGHNLATAIQDYLLNRGLKAANKQDQPLLWMRSFEQRYGGNLVWVKNEEQAEFLRNAIEANKALFNEGGFSE
jgi:hypothetical protein